MKENYLKIVLLLLIVVIAIQGYYLYDINRPKNVGSGLYVHSIHKTPVGVVGVEPMDIFFDEDINPFIEMERLRQKMESNFRDIGDYFQSIPSFSKFISESYRVPRFDMKEKNGKYIIIMEIPGSLKDAIETKIENGRLLVNAKVSQDKDDNTTSYYRHERHISSYRHEVVLPADANADSLQKEYKDGLLTLTINKKNP